MVIAYNVIILILYSNNSIMSVMFNVMQFEIHRVIHTCTVVQVSNERYMLRVKSTADHCLYR